MRAPGHAAPHRHRQRTDRGDRGPVRGAAGGQVQAVRGARPAAADPADPRGLAPRRGADRARRATRRGRAGPGTAAGTPGVRARRRRACRTVGPVAGPGRDHQGGGGGHRRDGAAWAPHSTGPEGEGAQDAIHQAAAGRTRPAADARGCADRGSGVRRAEWPGSPSFDAGDADARLVRAGALLGAPGCVPRAVPVRRASRRAGRTARYSGRPGGVRLPPGSAGRDPLRPGAGSVVAEPAPRGRLERPVRGGRRTPAPACARTRTSPSVAPCPGGC